MLSPRLPELLKSVVVMGGAYTVPGNTTPAAEFNILVDPEAAEQVFTAPFPNLTAVGLDVTEQVALTRDDWDAVNAALQLCHPRRAFCARSAGLRFPNLGREQFSLHDPLAVAVAIDPTLVETDETRRLPSILSNRERGRTRIVGPGNGTRRDRRSTRERALRISGETVGLPTVAPWRHQSRGRVSLCAFSAMRHDVVSNPLPSRRPVTVRSGRRANGESRMTDRESLIEQAPIQDRDLLQRMSLYFDAVEHRLRHGRGLADLQRQQPPVAPDRRIHPASPHRASTAGLVFRDAVAGLCAQRVRHRGWIAEPGAGRRDRRAGAGGVRSGGAGDFVDLDPDAEHGSAGGGSAASRASATKPNCWTGRSRTARRKSWRRS